MNILLADDHAMVRRAFRRMLTHAFPRAEFGEAGDSAQTLEFVLAQPWDIVILEIAIPGSGGLHVIKKIHEQRPKIPVLVVSTHAEPRFVVRALRAGAAGYLDKLCSGGELLQAVGHIQGGGRYLSSTLAEQWVAVLGRATSDVLDGRLSDREFEVLRKIATGSTLREIARDLLLSVSTISAHRMHILEKMNMLTNAELTHYAHQHGLVA